MDIQLISINLVGLTCNATFVASVDDVQITGKAINRWHKNPVRDPGTFILQLVFDNKEIIKHPKYKDIRTTLIELILRKAEHSYFAINVKLLR